MQWDPDYIVIVHAIEHLLEGGGAGGAVGADKLDEVVGEVGGDVPRRLGGMSNYVEGWAVAATRTPSQNENIAALPFILSKCNCIYDHARLVEERD